MLTAPDGAVSVAIGGDLDIVSAPAARERLLSLLRPGACRLVVDAWRDADPRRRFSPSMPALT